MKVVTRTNTVRRNRNWGDPERRQLEGGWDYFNDSKWSDILNVSLADRAAWPPPDIRDDMVAAWGYFKPEVMAEYADKFVRPWAWWMFDADPEVVAFRDSREYQHANSNEAETLDYFKLLTNKAIAAIEQDFHLCRGILNHYAEPIFVRPWGWWRFLSPVKRDYAIEHQAVQLAEIGALYPEILCEREAHILEFKTDLSDKWCGPPVHLPAAAAAALGLPSKFVCPSDLDDE